MKKMIAVMLMFLTAVCLVACTTEEDSSSQTNIRQMTVRYTVDGENYRSLKADFLLNEKTVTDHIGSTSETRTLSLENSGDLLAFLESSVVPALTDEATQSENGSEMQIIWSIQIVTDTATLRGEGFEGEAAPGYWEDLLRYLQP